MAERAHDLISVAREPETETTAPIDVKLRSVALVVIASAAAIALLHWAREVFIPVVLSVLISYALEPAMVATVPDAAAKLRVALHRNNTSSGTINKVQQAANELQRAADETAARNPV